MASTLDDLTVLYYDDLICMLNGAEPVRNDDGGAVLRPRRPGQ